MEEGDTAMKEYPISQARPKLSPLLDQVEQGDVAVIERRGFKALVVRLEDEQELLARCYGFTPQVRMDPSGAAHIWLPELALNAQGASLDDAEEAARPPRAFASPRIRLPARSSRRAAGSRRRASRGLPPHGESLRTSPGLPTMGVGW